MVASELSHALALGAALVLSVPVLVLVIEIACARRPGKGVGHPVEAQEARLGRPTIAVVMPAHDEASGIAAAVASVRSQLLAHDRLIVVADNCSDTTARVAADAGAEVIERHDDARRGKGYALDFGVRHLAASPRDVVVIVDADCQLGADALERVATLCHDRGRPVQALYLMRSPQPATLRTRVAEFAWIVKNHVRPLGFHRLGLPCQLMGTGMAFPWPIICVAPLATGHLVEDLQLGLDLAAAGSAPRFCPEALVTSLFPTTGPAQAAQRTRWEHGHLGLIVGTAPRMLWRAAIQRNGDLAAMVADLCVPPIAALTLTLLAVLIAAAGVAIVGGRPDALFLAAVEMLLLIVSILIAWQRFARHVLGWRELATAPLYLLAKIPFYARLLRKRQTEWVRTRRGDGGH